MMNVDDGEPDQNCRGCARIADGCIWAELFFQQRVLRTLITYPGEELDMAVEDAEEDAASALEQIACPHYLAAD